MEQALGNRVLIAEDDLSLRKLVATALRREGLDVTTTVHGGEAVTELERTCWDVLVLDLMMPTMSGWDVIAWLARHPDRKPRSVIVVSAASRAILRELDPAVVNAIIFKPFDVLQLGAYVKAACKLPTPDRRKTRTVGAEP
jgi:two-component system phosphate regulon response regulator PhoB